MKTIFIMAGICTIMFIVSCLQSTRQSEQNDSRGYKYAGSEACVKCHNNIYKSYLHTAHFLASGLATKNTIHGTFAKGLNTFVINDSQKIVMEKSDSGFFQTYFLNEKVKQRYRFDIVFGGIKGESYLYWKDNELYQLPISFYTSHKEWSTSPGYGLDFLSYNQSRTIRKQCMECHSSYINDLPSGFRQSNKNEQFDKNSLIYSVDCERCHGPAVKHVEFQTQNSEDKTPHYITTYSSLNRSQRIDMCAICHSGKPVEKLRSTFEFVPGDSFANFKIPVYYQTVDSNPLDVHGNQVQLLQSSKCFIFSKMDCATCHDPHQNSRGNDALFTQKCLACHNTSTKIVCKISNSVSDQTLKTNCINCHMPALPTKVITVQVSDTSPSVLFYVHTHHIATYPEQVKKILAYMNK